MERGGQLSGQADQQQIGQHHGGKPHQQPHSRHVPPNQPDQAKQRLAQQHQPTKHGGQPGQGHTGQLPGATAVLFELGREHGQVAGRQGPFAEEPAEKVGDAIGDHEGVHHAPTRQPEQRRGGHVADHAQDAAGQRPQAGNPGPRNERMSGGSIHPRNRRGSACRWEDTPKAPQKNLSRFLIVRLDTTVCWCYSAV
ncbi:MAG: hypothetical protein A2V70_08815 [Planctomycetes bacterium RBG_13_63_9]|nr:MAG: hypothetical protein A2V70_08815 [Planctomycetes bacterium RBG_13_63_9]